MESERNLANNSNELESITPVPEERNFNIDIVECIHEDSNYQSQSDEIAESELEDVVGNENDEEMKSEDNGIIADENSILEKFLTKRSPKKVGHLSLLEQKNAAQEAKNIKDDTSHFLQTEYNADSKFNNLSHDEITEKINIEEMKEEEEISQETSQRWLIPTSKVVVCASGFANDKKEKIKESVSKLGGTFSYDFTANVNVLITFDNHSDKYRAARRNYVHTVQATWLKDSIKHDYFLQPENYLFPLFYQYKFYFHDCETKDAVSKVKKYRAEVVVEIDSSMTNYLYIVIPNENIEGYVEELRREYSFFSNAFDDNVLKLVTLPWIDAYIEKEFSVLDSFQVMPSDYPSKHEEKIASMIRRSEDCFVENSKTNKVETKNLQRFIKKQEEDIEEHIEKLRHEPDFRKTMFLMDANISLHNVHDKEERTVISRLVNVSGAFIYDAFIPGITTHIITSHPDKELNGKAGSFDNTVGPYVVTKQWLIDSILSGKREDEKFYLPTNIQQVNNSLSTPQLDLQKKKSFAKQGTLFKSHVFCIETESYSPAEIEDITDQIETNGGSVVSEHIQNSVAKYKIMNDGFEKWGGFVLDKNDEGKYVVSHRFIDRCLKHKTIVSLKKEKAMDLLPLPYKPPYAGTSNLYVAFTLFPSAGKDREVLSNLASLMGMNLEFSEANTTHLIVNSEKTAHLQNSAKIQMIQRAFRTRKPKVVLFEWFLQ